MDLRDVINKTDKVKPVGEVNGVQLVTFEEQRDLAQLHKLKGDELGTVQLNPDGSVARTPVRFAAVNLDSYYINRYRKVKDSIYLVTDYQAIREQASGRIYAKQLQAYVIKRNPAGSGFLLEKVVNISDDEFIAGFTHSLNREAMAQLMPVISAGVGVTQDELPI